MPASEIEFNGIVAMCAENNGIGKNNDLPWSIPEDHHYYIRVVKTTRDTSKRNAVLMGRFTWESIPKEARPFEPCLNVIISSKMTPSEIECRDGYDTSQILICKSLEEAKQLVREKYADEIETIYSLGGAGLYRLAFESADFKRLYLTRVLANVECDVHIEPKNFLDKFKRVEEIGDEKDLYQCDYNTLKKDPTSGLEYIFEIYQKV